MKYMLDTNTCIFAIYGDGAVRSRFIREHSCGIAVSAITEAELWYGIENSKHREKNAHTLRSFLVAVEILPFDSLAAAEYGRVRAALRRAGTPIGERDTLIAAHVKTMGMTLVTNNIDEFSRVAGLMFEDWKV